MKKLFFSILVIIFLFDIVLLPQRRGNVSFVDFIEEMQYVDLEGSVSWFKSNLYSSKLNVDPNIFSFYKGISQFASYVTFQGAITELQDSMKDFSKTLYDTEDDGLYYADRAFLYIGAGSMYIKANQEVAGRIFENFLDTRETSHPLYMTALFWSTYIRYLSIEDYTYNYETLMQISEDPRVRIYDYSTASVKPLYDMMKKLKQPLKANLLTYEWTKDNTDVYDLINNVVLSDEELKSNKFAPTRKTSKKAEEDSFSRQGFQGMPVTPSESTKDILVPKGDSNKAPSTNATPSVLPATNTIVREQNSFLKNSVLKVMVRNKSGKALNIRIDNNEYRVTSTTNFSINLNLGRKNISTAYGGNVYTNSINILENKNNVFSIIVDDGNTTKGRQYTINNSGISRDVRTSTPMNQANAKDIRIIINRLLAQEPKIATDWFNINPYTRDMGIPPEEYSYYRGVAYYSLFINDSTKNPSHAAQALADLQYAYTKKDDKELLIKSKLYLAATTLFAYGNVYDADRLLAEAQVKAGKSSRYTPSIIYLRLQIGASGINELARLKKELQVLPRTTTVIDFKTTRFQPLSIMLPLVDKSISIVPVDKVAPILSSPKQQLINAANNPKYKDKNILLFVDDTRALNRYGVTISSIGINSSLPYNGNILKGDNDILLQRGDVITPIKINARENDAYSILLVSEDKE